MDNPSRSLPPNWSSCGVELFGHNWCKSSLVGNEELAPVIDQRRALPSSCLPRKVFLLNFIGIRCSLARSGGSGRRSISSDRLLNITHFIYIRWRTIHGKL